MLENISNWSSLLLIHHLGSMFWKPESSTEGHYFLKDIVEQSSSAVSLPCYYACFDLKKTDRKKAFPTLLLNQYNTKWTEYVAGFEF